MSRGDASPWLRRTSFVLFFAYVGLLILAGAEGLLLARLDQRVLLGLELGQLPDRVQANLLSQYRFLRGIELGFGLFAFLHRGEIHTDAAFNRLFLTGMAAGILGRVVSLLLDGSPAWWMYAFGIVELAGIVAIFAYTRTTLRAAGSGSGSGASL